MHISLYYWSQVKYIFQYKLAIFFSGHKGRDTNHLTCFWLIKKKVQTYKFQECNCYQILSCILQSVLMLTISSQILICQTWKYKVHINKGGGGDINLKTHSLRNKDSKNIKVKSERGWVVNYFHLFVTLKKSCSELTEIARKLFEN